MKAVTWQGKRDVRVEDVPDPTIEEPTDAIVRITSSGICGSDLHLSEVLGPFMGEGDVLGHEPMGVVEEVGPEVANLAPGDRVVVPFQIARGRCWMCGQGLQTQCETTQVRDHGSPVGRLAHQMASLPPDAVAAKLIERAGVDRLNAFHLAIELVRRGGTISLIGV